MKQIRLKGWKNRKKKYKNQNACVIKVNGLPVFCNVNAIRSLVNQRTTAFALIPYCTKLFYQDFLLTISETTNLDVKFPIKILLKTEFPD